MRSTVATTSRLQPFGRADVLAQAMRGPFEFFAHSTWAKRRNETGISDFTFGNPQSMPLPAVVEALRTAAIPGDKDWFGYKTSEARAQRTVAESIRGWTGLAVEPADIAMTNGGFAAISVGLKAVTNPGDEVIINTPPWFFYEPLAIEAGLHVVKVPVRSDDFDLDLAAIAAAITPRTRVVIVNSPNNPTGRIYSQLLLEELAELLWRASRRNDRTIYLLSDEPYNRLVFDGRRFQSPAQFYPNTLIAYSYAKVLLTPGQRIGYLALPASMPERERARAAIETMQLAVGWAFPNALLQHALPDLERQSIDVAALVRKRDWVVDELSAMGYQLHRPEGTFYLMPRSPWKDDLAFAELLTEHDVFVLPGSVFEAPGYFRISLTASEEMIARALPGFRAAIEHAVCHLPGANLAAAD